MRITSVLLALLLSVAAVTAHAQDTLRFAEHTALGGKVTLQAPAGFGRMTPEALRIKYPGQRPPTEVLSNERGSINIAFGHTQTAATPAQVRELYAAIEQGIKRAHPAARFNRNEVVRRGDREFAVLDFWTRASDTTVRNIMLVTSVDDRLLVVSFNVTRELEGEWGPIGERIMESIRVLP
jgi:hypothetical protein